MTLKIGFILEIPSEFKSTYQCQGLAPKDSVAIGLRSYAFYKNYSSESKV